MDVMPQLVNAGLFVLMGLVLNRLLRDKFREQAKLIDVRFEAVDRRFEAVGERFDAVDKRFDALERRFDRLEDRVDGLASENRGMRADLTQIALAVGARTRPQTG